MIYKTIIFALKHPWLWFALFFAIAAVVLSYGHLFLSLLVLVISQLPAVITITTLLVGGHLTVSVEANNANKS